MAAAGTSEEFGSGDITSSLISQDSEKINLKDSLENSVDADISQNTESHTAEMFLASVGLQPSSRDQKELQETKILESKPMEQSNTTLPPGWKKIYVQRMAGKTAGKYDAYIFSPDGRKHRSKTELFAYLEKKNLADQYNINDFDFTVRDVHIADGTDSTTSSTPASQTKAERKRSKSLTPKQARVSETSSNTKKSKKHKAVEESHEISPPVEKLVETSSKKSKKRKAEPSEPSSTPSVSSVKKFKKMKTESEKSELTYYRKKVKSSPKSKLPMKKLKIKLKFALPPKREKVLLDNTTNDANESEMPDSLQIKAIDNESLDKTMSEAVSDVSEKDLFERSFSDTSIEMTGKELQDRSLNDGNSETNGKELCYRSIGDTSSDLDENELQHKSPSEAVDEMIEKETHERNRNEAMKYESSSSKNSISSKVRDESNSSQLPDYETPSHISEMPVHSKRYRRDSERDLPDEDVEDGNDQGSANTSYSTFSSSYSKITTLTKTNTGSKMECNNNSPKHVGSECKTESKVEPLPTEDVCISWPELDHCNNVEQLLQPDDVSLEKKWYPPQSPYNLIEEQLDNDPWKVLVVSIIVESGEGCVEAGSLPRRSVKEFFKLCPSPKRVKMYGKKQILRRIKEYGISEETVDKISKFSEEYLSNPGNDPSRLRGIGSYGQDTYRIFCVNEWKQVVPENRKLKEYHSWLWRNHRVFCKN